MTALHDEDRSAAQTELAQHLSHTALRVLDDCMPDCQWLSHLPSVW